ncbi:MULTISPECIES: MarR family winged helix-turn-helix transcriptional regulator [Ferrimonas]|uniref:MarR family winged helix-turn-helix transcriptional regulator n=1 Tax=Ferrimonas TaxID=44011 RepID=UPI0003FA99DC|nr:MULTISPECIES: MarR family transcriptional regulator [Ferrimonas]USD38115.1 MarR family transcriptional regulator [Ferrimonas sp. SCSIO 43195]
MPHLDQLNHAIIEFYEKLSSWEHSVVKEIGVTLAHVHAVELLGIHGAMRMKELAMKMSVTTGTMTVQVDNMVKADLVRRRPHDTDRRSILVELTEKGQQIYQNHDALHHDLTQQITSGLDTTQQQALLNCLIQMNREF